MKPSPAYERTGRRLPCVGRAALVVLIALNLSSVQAAEAAGMGGMGDMKDMPGMDGMDHQSTSPAMDNMDTGPKADAPGRAMPAPGTGRPAVVAPTASPKAASATHGPNTIIKVDEPPIHMKDPNRGIPMPGMDMADDKPNYLLMVNQLEFVKGAGSRGYAWDAEGYVGGDIDKLWVKTSGQHLYGKTDDARVEALWSHAYQTYWNWQFGVRHDFGYGPNRDWLAAGVQGLAPYFFNVEATAYAGPSGRTAIRLRTDYDFILTQRLFLTPEAELNAYGKSDPGREIGSGLSDLRLGLRLRYEIRREIAPYIGVVFGHRFGQTAEFARRDGEPTNDKEIVVGVRFWY